MMQNQISADAAKYHFKVIFGLYLDYYLVINSYKSEAHALIGPWVATTVAWPVPAPVARGPHGPPNHCYES